VWSVSVQAYIVSKCVSWARARWVSGKRKVGQSRQHVDVQFLAPLQVLVVVYKVIPALPQGPEVYACVLTRLWRVGEADGPAQRRRRELLDALSV
jgi:hypothetical protein